LRKKISLSVIALFVTAFILFTHGCSSGKEEPAAELDDELAFDINSASLQKFKERLGTDDGYAFTLFYGADTHGSLENCGCPNNPMGGLTWRISYMKAFRQRSNKEVPMLFVDAGNLFTDDRYQAGQLPPEALIKNRWVVKGYGDFLTDAANLCFGDLPYAAELLKKEGFDQRVKELPFIKKLVSANLHPEHEGLQAPAPYVIREIALRRGAPGKKLRIGIVGFTQLKQGMGNQLEDSYAGFKIEDPLAAAKRVLPELKQKADIIVALAYMSQGQAQALASQNPEIDSVIGAQQINGSEEAKHFGSATLVYSYNQTKYLGELRYYIRPDGSIENQLNRHVGLDKEIPEDPAALTAVNGARDEFTAEQKKTAQQATPGAEPIKDSNSEFAGAQACAACHVEEYQVWERTGHAHAMASLERKNQQFDNECVKCHVVGFDKGGFQSLTKTPQLANVQCESCHGPGKAHIAKPAKGFGAMQTPAGCVQCHTVENSPDFNFASYWPKIRHGKAAADKAD
jgi:2',3'-cyclic-nucleotide 2'-phosphodiesterase (5'-nucleotidase family)